MAPGELLTGAREGDGDGGGTCHPRHSACRRGGQHQGWRNNRPIASMKEYDETPSHCGPFALLRSGRGGGGLLHGDAQELFRLRSVEDIRRHEDLLPLEGSAGGKNLSELIGNMQIMDGRLPPDAQGAYRFPGGIPGLYTISEGLVVIHPDGRIWAAYLHDGRVDYFTNDNASIQGSTTAPPSTRRSTTLKNTGLRYRLGLGSRVSPSVGPIVGDEFSPCWGAKETAERHAGRPSRSSWPVVAMTGVATRLSRAWGASREP